MRTVADAMTSELVVAVPEMAMRDAARLMAELDAGVLPVVDGGKLVGMVTDRDIAVRGVALGLGPETPVTEVMTRQTRYCFVDDTLEDAVRGMGDLQIRRMPVLDRTESLVGILSLSDALRETDATEAGTALSEISEPGGEHSQSDEVDPHLAVAPSDVGTDDATWVLHFTDDEPT